MAVKKDNSTLRQKVWLRRRMLAGIERPCVVMETHGGLGGVYDRCYRRELPGVVIEKDSARCDRLAWQRQTWAVYNGDSAKLLAAGLRQEIPIDVLDVDPYGDPWPTIMGFFGSDRAFADSMHIVVNDGMRNKVRMGGAWTAGSLKAAVREFGADLFPIYLETCRWLLGRAIEPAGYRIESFQGYYCGHNGNMTHYLATLRRSPGVQPDAD